MSRKFAMLDDKCIQFDEDILQLNVSDEDITQITSGRDLVTFNKVNVIVLDLLFDYDLTEEEEIVIRDHLWLHYFRVSRSS